MAQCGVKLVLVKMMFVATLTLKKSVRCSNPRPRPVQRLLFAPAASALIWADPRSRPRLTRVFPARKSSARKYWPPSPNRRRNANPSCRPGKAAPGADLELVVRIDEPAHASARVAVGREFVARFRAHDDLRRLSAVAAASARQVDLVCERERRHQHDHQGERSHPRSIASNVGVCHRPG